MIDFVGIVFAILIVIGGIIGYVKGGSVPSLVAGVLFGVLLAIGSYFNSIEQPIPLIQVLILLALVIMMGVRWYRTEKFMPAGMICLLSVAVLIWTCVAYRGYFVERTVELIDGDTAQSKTVNATMM